MQDVTAGYEERYVTSLYQNQQINKSDKIARIVFTIFTNLKQKTLQGW